MGELSRCYPVSVLMVTRYITARVFPSPPDVNTAIALLGQITETRADQYPQRVDRPLALYGAGDLGRMARDYFAYIGLPIELVVDRNAERLAGSLEWQGVRLLPPDAVPMQARQSMLLAVCIATVPYAPLEAELSQAGWLNIVPFYDIAEAYRDRHPLSNGWFASLFDDRDRVKISTVLTDWADDRSRACHLQFLAWRRLREEWTFVGAPVTINDRYFIPEVCTLLSNHEAFADIGAHEGHVIQRFLDAVKGQCGRIWAVEPDPRNLVQLRETVSHFSLTEESAVQIIPSVVADAEGEAIFAGGLGYASQLSALGQEQIAVTTIDQLEIAPSFMKLHLEGHELGALRGAVATLRRHRPLLAVTIYHSDVGVWKLPSWLMEELINYRYYLRLHSWCGTGAVMYGIPEERLCN